MNWILTLPLLGLAAFGVACAYSPHNGAPEGLAVSSAGIDALACSPDSSPVPPFPRDRATIKPGTPTHIAEAKRDWAEAISRKVIACWRRPQSMPTGLVVSVQANVSPSGEVLYTEILEPSTHLAFDESILKAIQLASPLPLPTTSEAFEPVLLMKFVPESLIRQQSTPQ